MKEKDSYLRQQDGRLNKIKFNFTAELLPRPGKMFAIRIEYKKNLGVN